MRPHYHWHVTTTAGSRVRIRKVRCPGLICPSGLTTFEQARGEAINRAATLRLTTAERVQSDYALAQDGRSGI